MNQTDLSDRISRRFALKGAGLMAAALALPAAAAIAPTAEASREAEIIHGPYCFHELRRAPELAPELERLQDEFSARVDHETWLLHDRIVNLATDRAYDEQNAFVDELARHFPGLAPAIRGDPAA
jgi:hypothetical protein